MLTVLLKGMIFDTFAAGFGLVPGSIFSAAQDTVSRPRQFHQIARVTAVGYCVVEGKLTSKIDAVGYRARVSTTDNYRK